MMFRSNFALAAIAVSTLSASSAFSCLERSDKVKIAECHTLINGNVSGSAVYTYSSFPVAISKVNSSWGYCNGTSPTEFKTTYEIRLDQKFNGSYVEFISGAWEGPMPGPDTITMHIGDASEAVETADGISIKQKLTGHKTTMTTAFYDKQNNTLELKTTVRKALIPKTIGHVLLQCK